MKNIIVCIINEDMIGPSHGNIRNRSDREFYDLCRMGKDWASMVYLDSFQAEVNSRVLPAVGDIIRVIDLGGKPEYFLFGEDAVRILEDENIEALKKWMNANEAGYALIEFDPMETTGAQLIAEAGGWARWIPLSKEEYEQLI
jgi:hypothetical protein